MSIPTNYSHAGQNSPVIPMEIKGSSIIIEKIKGSLTLEIFQRWVSRPDFSLTQKGSGMWTVLTKSIKEKNIPIIDWILQQPEAKELAKAATDAQRTPLHHLMNFPHKEEKKASQIALQLLELGADPNAIDVDESSPIFLAAEKGLFGCVNVLLAKEVVVKQSDLRSQNLISYLTKINEQKEKNLLTSRVLSETKACFFQEETILPSDIQNIIVSLTTKLCKQELENFAKTLTKR